MSIAYFPDIYPDELVYSVLARTFRHGGYISFKYAAEDFFVNPKIRVEKEFVKNLKPEVIDLLTKHMNIETLLEQHTMYPLYGRFIPKERRECAFRALMKMEGDFSKLFGIPNLSKGEQRYLRFCPVCAKGDRVQLGEAYWHRKHQIRGINVCYRHQCYLQNSPVSVDSRNSVNLVSAEECIPAVLDIEKCENSLEIRFAEYMVNVFESPIDKNNETAVAKFLHAKLVGTPYISLRGEHKYYTKLWKDMQVFYKSVTLMAEVTSGHIQRALMGTRTVFEEICMIAMFLNLPEEELVKMQVPLATPQQEFDQKVIELMNTGMSMREIAMQMGVALSIVRMVNEIAQKEQVELQKKIGQVREPTDWTQIDAETLPMVIRIIAELHGTNGSRPRRVSVYAVSKLLNMPAFRLQKLKKCMGEIESNRESDEKYHARKVKWAINLLEEQGKPIKVWRICAISKLEKEDIGNCLQELQKMVDPERAALVEKELD